MTIEALNEDQRTTAARLLRAEISRLGAAVAGRSEDRYLLDVGTEYITGHLRQAVSSGAQPSAPLALLLRLNDDTLQIVIAGLRESAGASKPGEVPTDEAVLADTLAESYLDNHRLSVLLRAATEQLSVFVKRLERLSVVPEGDAACRDALEIIGTYHLWRDEPENPTVTNLLDELAQRVQPVRRHA